MKLRLHRIFICQAFAMLRNVQQRKLRLSPFEQHGVPFTLVVAESDIFPVNVPVASLQLSDQFAFGYLPAPQKPVWTDIVGGRDSLLLATLAYNVGPYRLLGSGKIPKSTLIRKLEAGDRNIYREYIAFCNYKGKRHAMLLKRRKAEFALLYVP